MKVRVRHTFEVVHELNPAIFRDDENGTLADHVNFLFNESSSCSNNVLRDIEAIREREGCCCRVHSAEFVEVVV